jgi:hypothetical protein
MSLKSRFRRLVKPALRHVEEAFFSFAIKQQRTLFSCSGITIAQVQEGVNPEWISSIKDAIDAIEFFDARRFARLQKHVHYVCIANPGTWLSTYLLGSKICVLNLFRLRDTLPPERELWLVVAQLLISCTVDADLHAKQIAFEEKHHWRIERLRDAEMDRVARRIMEGREGLDKEFAGGLQDYGTPGIASGGRPGLKNAKKAILGNEA